MSATGPRRDTARMQPGLEQQLLRRLSLDALRGFEAAARRRSFTDAANELGLTPSAVSKQVRGVEQALQRPLFLRSPGGLRLTADAQPLLHAVQCSLERLGMAAAQVAGLQRRTVRMTTWPSFASLWMAPKLDEFVRSHPGIDITLDGSVEEMSLERDGFDLALRLMHDPRHDEMHLPLGIEQTLLVASPTVAAGIRAPQDLLTQTLLCFWDPAERFPWMHWPHWFSVLGLPPPPPAQRLVQFTSHELAVRAAEEGVGVAIARTPALLHVLAQRRLVNVLPDHRAAGQHYGLVTARPHALPAAVKVFSEWLLGTLGADAARWDSDRPASDARTAAGPTPDGVRRSAANGRRQGHGGAARPCSSAEESPS